MGYEIPGFDPTSLQDNPDLPFSVWHQDIHHVGVHVVHPEEIYRRIDAGRGIKLVDYQPPVKGNIKQVDGSVAVGKNYSGQDAALYEATIRLRKEQDWQTSFLNFVDTGTYTRLQPEPFHWGNVRLLRRPSTNMLMQATILSNRIVLDNQDIGINDSDPLKTTRLSAPAKGSVKASEQLLHYFDCLTAMMCIAQSLGKQSLKSPCGVVIVTPDGPLHRNPDTGEYVHRLDPETVTVTPPAKKPEQQHPTFKELFGIEDVIDQLRPAILFYTRPDLAAKWQVQRPGNILLFGPPGTGKTAIAFALQQEVGATLHAISPADIYGKWMGDSERAIKAVFDKVRNAKNPTILLLDEMEGIVNIVESDTSGSRATNAVAGIFKTESANVTAANPNVIIVATTNDPNRLDPALIRAGRFDVRIAMSLPNAEARRRIYGNLILNYHSLDVGEHEPSGGKPRFNPHSPELLEPEALAELVGLTEHDFSAADIIESLRQAAIAKAYEEQKTRQEPELIDLAFLSGIIATMRRNRA